MPFARGRRARIMAERVFFVVDRSKLKEETDELRNAIVVYMPKSDLKKVMVVLACETELSQ